MSSNALKILALVALVLAVVLGLMAYNMSQDMARTPETAQSAGAESVTATTMAVVVLKPLVAYSPVAAESVALVPVAVLPDEYFTRTEDVVGRAPLADVPTGTTLGPRYFREANTLVRSIPPGFQAMSLEINDVIAVGGFVRPGDLVDVLLYIRSSGREVADSQARVLLREVRVLAYEERVLNDAEPSDAGSAEPNRASQQRSRRNRTAVLAVPEGDTTRVMLGASLGELRLALRGAQPEQAGTEPVPGELLTSEVVMPAPLDDAAPVVTLRELSAIKKQQQPGDSHDAPGSSVVIYRGSEVQNAKH